MVKVKLAIKDVAKKNEVKKKVKLEDINIFEDSSINNNQCFLQAIVESASITAKICWTNNFHEKPGDMFRHLLNIIKSKRTLNKGITSNEIYTAISILAKKNNMSFKFKRLCCQSRGIYPLNYLLTQLKTPGSYVAFTANRNSDMKSYLHELANGNKGNTEQELADLWWSRVKNKKPRATTHAIGILVKEDKSIFYFDNG